MAEECSCLGVPMECVKTEKSVFVQATDMRRVSPIAMLADPASAIDREGLLLGATFAYAKYDFPTGSGAFEGISFQDQPLC